MNNSLFDLNLNKGVETQKSDLSPQSASVLKTSIKVSKKYCKGVTLTCGCNITGGK
ncbi:epilancin family lantibiotic [Staphylococcus casei]|uniref:Lantibiotic epilancin n=2 Tax=Staphylococcus TaxID=1279 RepID=LANEL_STAEP|nr:RecName: Full=Lantibiotic epilancin; Flags: Precursor [Staphylococcus epidermidis]AAA79236.1 lantibiotic epilancin K7 [Staphylococcus epidermidis]CAA60860.1 elkA [Staphylococcus epidermidis]